MHPTLPRLRTIAFPQLRRGALMTLQVNLAHRCNQSCLRCHVNPGPSLPPNQQALEADYKRVLSERYGIVFNQLFCLANMPVQRFGSTLISKGEFEAYMDVLEAAHRPENLPGVMCRTLVSVDYRGFLYDCDFNQMLG